ncbi:alpha-galactosidase [Lacisediminihabitans profunda]|uniref:alpha-galactosidase n=1 Tax=Lacisediminihabitans profunda TaxID=2594790 RepID=A0A5C8UUZ9_9MICO|nr:alpha-galactosidase [Lacisediminihabitans profunda]TXN32474.1 alpha-galactosidase [Lacisediminihabitans profunda]
MQNRSDELIHLRAAGVSLVMDATGTVPRVIHWGGDLGPLDDAGLEGIRLTASTAQLNNAPDEPRVFSIWPTEFEGWSGTQALGGHLAGTATTPRPVLSHTRLDAQDDGGAVTFTLADAETGLDIDVEYRLTPDGVLEVQSTVTRPAAPDGVYDLASLSTMMPVPSRATEIADFTGKWARERSPQRLPVRDGAHSREVRRGKPGVDSPYLLMVGTPAFGFRRGEVWAMHVAYSGDQRWFVERLPEGAGAHSSVIGGGELLRAGEVRLRPGESYASPRMLFVWSSDGMDGVADRLHARLRRRAQHPSSPRPLVLNTWEAVYFDHRLDRLAELVDRAAAIGIERVVLDDGWFAGRRDDSAGLGDWTVDDDVWPLGLRPLVDRIRDRGMQFGLWFEPEMTNLDSELARTHPDWLLAPSSGVGLSSRHQYVVNIAHPEAWAYLLERIDALVTEYSIDFLKWDHNRDLNEAVSRTGGGDRPGVRAQTIALYALIDELKARHPGLEIETCASGGGRIDLGVLERTDRVWASDCNDPVERQSIQQWTSLLLPPELIGSHVGAPRSHTTGRVADAPFRLATTLFAHAGVEWDLTECTEDELETLRAWSALYREFRPLIHHGRTVHADLAHEATLLHGSVAVDGSRALYCWARLATSAPGQSGRVPLPGLDPARGYRIRVREDLGRASLHQGGGPAWFDAARAGWVDLPGSVLAAAGLPMPTLNPAQAILFEVDEVR